MGRHSENTGDFVYLKFTCFQKLRLFGWYAHLVKLESFFQNRYLVGVCTAELGLPAFPQAIGLIRFDDTGVFKNSTGVCAVGKKGGAVILCGKGKSDGVLCHSDGRIAD